MMTRRVSGLLLAMTLVTCGLPASALAQSSEGPSLAVEADALAFGLGGYSGIFRVSLGSGLNVALGAGRYNVPGFILEGQETFDQAQWEATATSIQVLRVGYRFGAPMSDSAVVDAIVINQRWELESPSLGAKTTFRPFGVGVSGGYYWHLGRHFYIYPTASVTWNTVYGGEAAVNGVPYEVATWQFSGSVHVGWEWSF